MRRLTELQFLEHSPNLPARRLFLDFRGGEPRLSKRLALEKEESERLAVGSECKGLVCK
jgi:hypothetical protein